ncbi:MAG: GTPase [Planctomycetota bacterium]
MTAGEFCAQVLTAPGVAAIAVLRLTGPQAEAFLQGRFRRPGAASDDEAACRRGGAEKAGGAAEAVANAAASCLPTPGRFRRLTWIDAGGAADDTLVLQLPTELGGGFEVHGHGGTAGLVLWRSAVTGAGGTWIEEGTPPARHGHGDAEPAGTDRWESAAGWEASFADLWPGVRTEAQARILGAGSAAVARYWRTEPDRRRWPAAWLDELVHGVDRRRLRLQTWEVLLSGPVNAGKSTLLNALLADPRALTSDRPGTTRDAVRGSVEIAGLAVELVDSAGLRGGNFSVDGAPVQEIERRGMERTRAIQRGADLTVWLSPADQPAPPPADWRGVLAVTSKSDLAAAGLGGELAISAASGAGLELLCTTIAERLLPATDRLNEPTPGVCSSKQRDVILRWRRELAAAGRKTAG